MPTYSELRLRIDRGVAQGSYRIVATGPTGEALGRFKLPFADIELENFILKIGSTRRGKRRIDSPEMDLAKTFGTKLFGALFEGDVRELYRSSFAESRAEGRGLRVTLSLTGAPELLQVPWEYLYDHPSFLSISTWTPIVRYLDLPKPRRPLQIELPLRILALVSAPTDFETIDAAQERAKLESALAPLIEMGAIAIDWLEEASLRALQRQLRKADYHVFHYIGHGGYDNDADDGVLLFEDEQGRGRRVSGVQLGTILADEVSLRLAVLNSCEGGRSSLQDPFSGVATSLIEREIPAVIGMQFEITDRAAIVFSGEFYSALADGLAVDSSVAEARKAIYADQNDVEWGTPVLFMRVADGRLFDVKAHAPVRPVASPEPDERDVMPPVDEAASQDANETGDAAVAAAAAAERDRAETAAVLAAERERAAQAELDRAEAERAAKAADAAEAERAAEPERKRVADAEAAETAEAERLERERDEREAADAARAAAAARVATETQASVVADSSEAGVGPAVALTQPEVARPTTALSTTSPTVGVPRGVSRPAWRAAIGGVAGLAVTWLLVLIGSDSILDGFLAYLDIFVSEAIWTVVAMVAAVAIVEAVWPALRVPDGSAYRAVGGNRWVAAAIQGSIAGATVGFAATNAYYIIVHDDSQYLYLGALVVHAASTAVGFVFAEWILVRLTRARPDGDRADGGN